MKLFSRIISIGFLATMVGCGSGQRQTNQPTAVGTGHGSASAASPSSVGSGDDPKSSGRPGDGSGGDAGDDEQSDPKVIDLEPIRIEVVGHDPAGDPELQAFDARSLLDNGNAAMAEDRFDDAIGQYQKLLSIFPDSRLAPSAVYNIGLAHEAKDDYDAAIEQYRILARNDQLGREAIDAHMRIGGILAESKRWVDAAQALREVLARTDLTHSNKIEAMARLGYVSLEQKDYTNAESVLSEATQYYEKLTTGLESNYFIAMSYYYLAQIPHRQFRAWPMRLPDEQLKKDFAQKTNLVALAYDRYVTAVQIQHAYWATASGYQLSQIYKEFWDDIMLAPIPEHLVPDAREIYQRELHQQVRVLLEKAVDGHSKNVELSEAYRTTTPWSEASRTRAADIAEILARESSGELVIPKPSKEPQNGASQPASQGEYMPQRIEL